MPRLNARTVVVHPDTRAAVVLEAGDEVPDWADVGDHLIETSEPEKESTSPAGEVPPRHGAGSGKDAWIAYATDNSVAVPEGATRDEVIAAIEEAGVPTA